MTTKDYLHQLIDKLPENSTGAAEHFLEHLVDTGDPVLRALWAAPLEPLTDKERDAIEAGWEDIRADRTVTLEQVERELHDRQ